VNVRPEGQKGHTHAPTNDTLDRRCEDNDALVPGMSRTHISRLIFRLALRDADSPALLRLLGAKTYQLAPSNMLLLEHLGRKRFSVNVGGCLGIFSGSEVDETYRGRGKRAWGGCELRMIIKDQQ
jgi:hypothetical protein